MCQNRRDRVGSGCRSALPGLALPSDVLVDVDALPDLPVKPPQSTSVVVRLGRQNDGVVTHLYEQAIATLDLESLARFIGNGHQKVVRDLHPKHHWPPPIRTSRRRAVDWYDR